MRGYIVSREQNKDQEVYSTPLDSIHLLDLVLVLVLVTLMRYVYTFNNLSLFLFIV